MTGRKPTCFILVILFALAPAAARLAAAPPAWQPIAPGGGLAEFLAVDPRSGQVFASTQESGIYRSDDRGQSWTRASQGLPRFGPFQVWAGPGAAYTSAGDALFKLPLDLWLYSVLLLVAPILTPSPFWALTSFNRYLLAAFPLFVVLGWLLAQSRVLLGAWLLASAAVGVYLTVLFVTWRWVA